MTRDTTPVVDAISGISLEGNIVPHLWFKHVTFESGKPDLLGIMILADLVYWYRPTVEKDEATGEVVKVRKRFRDDMLCRSYEALAEQFGVTKRMAKDAVYRLKGLGLVYTELRTVKKPGLPPLSNVLFLAPVPAKVRAICTSDVHPRTFQRTRVSAQTDEGRTPERQTYSEIPLDISGEIEGSPPPGEAPLGKAPVDAGASRPGALAPSGGGFPSEEEEDLLDLDLRQQQDPLVGLNVRRPLKVYFGKEPGEGDRKYLRIMLYRYWRMMKWRFRQTHLDKAAAQARHWWENNKPGEPHGMRCFEMALQDVLGNDPDYQTHVEQWMAGRREAA